MNFTGARSSMEFKTDDEIDDELDMQALSAYIFWDDQRFESLTEGRRHRRSLISKLLDKKSTGLLRERLIARTLGLEHNPKMHSTTDGITTFDGVDKSNNDCYEIKAEEHTTNNPDRKIQSGQIGGVGVFSTIETQDHIDKLRAANPMIAHGMFGDGRLLSLSKFRLLDSLALDRISRYALGETSTEPRYALSDWINCPTLKLVYVADKWPAHIAPKCRNTMQAMWLKQTQLEALKLLQLNIASRDPYFDLLSRIDPNLQNTTPYTEEIVQLQILDLLDIQPIFLSEIS